MIKLLANRCRFHCSDSYVFDVEGKGVKKLFDENKSKTLLTVVGKEYTFETHKDLPISSKKEALLAAKHMKDVAPFKGQTYTLASSLEEGKTRVHFFVIKQDFIESQCRDSMVILPESLLLLLNLQKMAKPNAISGNLEERSIYASLSNDGYTCELRDLTTSGRGEFFPAFENDAVGADYEQQQYFKLLLKSVALLPSSSYRQVINLELFKSFWSPHIMKIGAIATLAFFTLYMSAVSGYLVLRENALNANLEEQQSSINELFAQQAQLDSMNEQLKGLADNRLFEKLSAPLWLLITELAEKGADISLVNFSGNDITLRMKAPKSTDIMHFLASSNKVTSPEVVSPAVKSGGKELFTVKFTLVGS